MADHEHTPGGCEVCGSTDEVYLHSRCHPNKPTWTVMRGNRLDIECSKCGKLITSFDLTGKQTVH